MKIFAIRDATDEAGKNLAYLLYYEIGKKFYIELPEDSDVWETPLLLDSFIKKGEHSVNSYWSKIWVQQRIVPPDRQNIAEILKNHGLKEYDEYSLLMIASGRCEQDDYYLSAIDESTLPVSITERFSRKIEDVAALKNNCLLVFFRDGSVRKCDLAEYFEQEPRFQVLLNNPEWYDAVEIQTGGFGLRWDDNLTLSNTMLYNMGLPVPLSADDFRLFASNRIINGAEAAEMLHCSRQYINELVKTGKLHPIKSSEKNTLFMKSEILQRLWS